MEHEYLIKKHLGVNTPDWIVANVQKAIDEALSQHDVSSSDTAKKCKQCGKEIEERFSFCSSICKMYYYR